jgi:hypothetical protein
MDNYTYVLNGDGTVTAYSYSRLPVTNRGCMSDGEKVAVTFANATFRANEQGTLHVVPGMVPMTPIPGPSRLEGSCELEVNLPDSVPSSPVSAIAVPVESPAEAPAPELPTVEPAAPPPPRLWFRTPGER